MGVSVAYNSHTEGRSLGESMGTKQPNYYAILPATVRYDNDLTPMAKLLYAEITALAEANGYCWAGNKYFAELYKCEIRTISRTISQLNDKGYIVVEIEQESGNSRKIFVGLTVKKQAKTTVIPMDKNDHRYRQQSQKAMDNNVVTPMDKNVQYNNTSPNTTSITVSKKVSREKALSTNNKEFGRESYAEILARCGIVDVVQEQFFKLIQFQQANKIVVTNEQLERMALSIVGMAQNRIIDGYGYPLFQRPDFENGLHQDEIDDYIIKSIQQALRGKYTELKAPKGWQTTQEVEQEAEEDMRKMRGGDSD